MSKVSKAIVPAAGLGTRFLPFTKSIPKEMLPIVDKPTIEYIIEELVNSGIDDILLINGRHKVSIIDYFDRSPELERSLADSGQTEELKLVEEISRLARIYSVRQKNPLGLGHAILCGKGFIGNEPFAVALGDDVIFGGKDPAIEQLIQVFERIGGAVVGVQEVPWSEVSLYGIASGDPEEEGVIKVNHIVEKPENSNSNLAVIGRYILPPKIFDILEELEPGAGGEIQLTDALAVLAEQGELYAAVIKGRRYDLGSKEGFLEATIETALRREDLRKPFMAYLKTLISSLDGYDF